MSDPVVDRWIDGWTAVRGCRVSVVDGWPLVHLVGPGRDTELVCVDPPDLTSLLPHVAGDPRAMLTVITADRSAYQSVPLPPSVRVDRDDEILMTTDLSPVEAPATELASSVVVEGAATRYELTDGERMVAWATVGVVDGWATFDRVETIPSHRRRGLGRHVMGRLTELAIERGATHGVLAASVDGRGLYEALGWSRYRDLWSLMGA